VQDDGGQQTEADENQSPDESRAGELDQPRTPTIRAFRRIRGWSSSPARLSSGD